MKKLLCVFGIIILFTLIMFPPALRILLPDKEEEKEQVVQMIRQNLNCSNQEFITNVSYDGDKVKMIIIKKLGAIENDIESENLEDNQSDDDREQIIEKKEYITGKEVVDTFEKLKTFNGGLHNILDDGEVVAVDFSIKEYPDLDVKIFTQEIETEKSFLESQKLNCTIIK